MGNQDTELLIKADLFIKADNNVENAKNLFKECKRTIESSYVVLGSSLFSQLKNQINDSDKCITSLITRIKETLQSLMALDSEFANEYETTLRYIQKIDTSDMTEEEIVEYNKNLNKAIKDYDFYLLYMFERLQKNGQLTPEIEKMIEQEYGISYEYQKAVCEQYKIQDQMAGVDVLSDEFKSLYKEYIKQGKNMILTDPKIDENTRQVRLNELDKQYNETINSIDESQKARTQARQQEQLQKLQLQKEYNNGLFHPGVEKEIDDAIINLRAEMGDQSAIDYLNMSDFEKGLHYTGTVCLSTFEGFLDLGEGLVDGTVYLTGKTVQVASLGHVDDKWAEDIISYDVSGNLYDWTVDAVGINSNIAYGSARSIGNFAGGGLGYYALSAVPYAGPFLCALAGAGKKTEESMIYQLETTGKIDDGKVLLNFALGAAEGYGAGKAATSMREGLKNISQLTNLKGILGKKGLKTTMSSVGDIAKKAAIRTFTKDVDTWIETAAVVADDIYTGFETGEWNLAKMYFEAAGVLTQNYIGNFGMEAMGNYQSKKTIYANENKVLEIYKKKKGIPLDDPLTFEQLRKIDPTAVKQITYDEYRIKVKDDKVEWGTKSSLGKDSKFQSQVELAAKTDYEIANGVDTWDLASKEIRQQYIDTTMKSSKKYLEIFDRKNNKAIEIADNTITKVESLVDNGYVKTNPLTGQKYTSDDIIRMIEADVPQSSYLAKEYINKEYIPKWGTPDVNGNVQVVAFQDGEIGAANYANVKANGNIGRSEGMFVMPKSEADAIIKQCTMKDGTINTKMLTEKLGGVPFTGKNVIMIEQTVNIKDIQLPRGSLDGAYLGDWVPGGKTSAGTTEGIVKQKTYTDSNVKISVVNGNPNQVKILNDSIKKGY